MSAGGTETGGIREPIATESELRQAGEVTRVPTSLSPRSLTRRAGSVPRWVWALAFYVSMAVLTVGRYAIVHPGTVCACVGTQDPAAYMWALSWWPHAIVHGLNPFVSHYLWSPTGVNVAQGAMIPTAAIAMAPVTALVGPIVSYNMLTVASPVLAAMTAYLLCRRVVGRELPSAVGGYLFGFGTYELAQLQGHPNLTLIFLIPAIAHVALRRGRGEISRRVYVVAMATLLVLQAGLSTELLADTVGVGAVALVAARFLLSARRRVDRLIVETIGAGVLAIMVAFPFLYYALFSGSFPKGARALSDVYGLDFLNLFFPTYATWLGHQDFLSLGLSFSGSNVTEAGGYLSIPLVLGFLTWALRDARNRSLAKLLSILVAVTLVAALGSHLHIAGHQTVALPFNWVRDLPIFDNLIPVRIVLFTTLAVSVGLADWLAADGRGSMGRWVLVALGIALLLPNVVRPLYGTAPRNPRFFATELYRQHISRGETVLALPFGANGVSMLWQAETGFFFYMPEGYVSGVVPAPFNSQLTVGQLVANVPPPAPALGSFIREHHVGHVVVDAANPGLWPGLLAQMGLHDQQLGGVLLYTVPPEPPPARRRAISAPSYTTDQGHSAKGPN